MSVNHRDPITGVLTQLAGNGAPTDVGTAAFKDFTDVVRAGDHRLVEANAVANAINQGLASIYTPRGDKACAELTSDLLIEANIGNVYETSDAGTTSALFIQGADHPIVKGDNVGIIKAGQNTIMFNLMGNAFDLHDYQKQELSTPIDISGTSYDSVESAMAGLNAQDARRKNLAYTYVSATVLKEVIKEILDNQLPVGTTDTDIYNGTISSTHSGGGDLGGWLGYYIAYVQKNYAYRSHGIVICQDRAFIISCPVIAEGWKVQEVPVVAPVQVVVGKATANGSKTFQQALYELSSSLSSMTDEQRRASYILYSNSKYEYQSGTSASSTYSHSHVQGTDLFVARTHQISTTGLSSCTYREFQWRPSGASLPDYSSATLSYDMYLCYSL